jgi:hypothetical protein
MGRGCAGSMHIVHWQTPQADHGCMHAAECSALDFYIGLHARSGSRDTCVTSCLERSQLHAMSQHRMLL